MTDSVVSVRLKASELGRLEQAARQAKITLSDFVRSKVLEAAEFELVHQSTGTIQAKDWAKIEAWADAPAARKPELADLLSAKPTWLD